MVNSRAMAQTLGDFIKKRLDELGINQKDLADMVGMSPGQISRIVTGERGTRLDNLLAIADALRIKRDDLIKVAVGESYEEPVPEDDPWVVEMNYKLTLLKDSRLRRAAEAIVNGLIDEERSTDDIGETKPRPRPAT